MEKGKAAYERKASSTKKNVVPCRMYRGKINDSAFSAAGLAPSRLALLCSNSAAIATANGILRVEVNYFRRS